MQITASTQALIAAFDSRAKAASRTTAQIVASSTGRDALTVQRWVGAGVGQAAYSRSQRWS